jgi:hypothetical protein
MSISTPPPPPSSAPSKKAGLGCLGCGCIFLVVIFLLIGGLIGGTGYLVYKAYEAASSETAADIPPANTDQQLTSSAQHKIADFAHDVKDHQAATITLSADELNALIANNPDAVKNNVHIFLSMKESEGRIQASIPTSAFGHGISDGRYLNVDSSFEVHFDQETNSIMFDFHTLHAGKLTLIGTPAADDQNGSPMPEAFTRSFAQSFGPSFSNAFNTGLKKSPDAENLLNQTKSVEIKNGQLEISTQ